MANFKPTGERRRSMGPIGSPERHAWRELRRALAARRIERDRQTADLRVVPEPVDSRVGISELGLTADTYPGNFDRVGAEWLSNNSRGVD